MKGGHGRTTHTRARAPPASELRRVFLHELRASSRQPRSPPPLLVAVGAQMRRPHTHLHRLIPPSRPSFTGPLHLPGPAGPLRASNPTNPATSPPAGGRRRKQWAAHHITIVTVSPPEGLPTKGRPNHAAAPPRRRRPPLGPLGPPPGSRGRVGGAGGRAAAIEAVAAECPAAGRGERRRRLANPMVGYQKSTSAQNTVRVWIASTRTHVHHPVTCAAALSSGPSAPYVPLHRAPDEGAPIGCVGVAGLIHWRGRRAPCTYGIDPPDRPANCAGRLCTHLPPSPPHRHRDMATTPEPTRRGETEAEAPTGYVRESQVLMWDALDRSIEWPTATIGFHLTRHCSMMLSNRVSVRKPAGKPMPASAPKTTTPAPTGKPTAEPTPVPTQKPSSAIPTRYAHGSDQIEIRVMICVYN